MRKARRPAWALLCGLAVAGCASSRTEWVESGAGGDSPAGQRARAEGPSAQVGPFDAKTFAARFRTPGECEAAARKLQARSRDQAWEALRACVEGMHFTKLQALLAPAWAEDLQVRPEAAALLARVVAYRGGSVEGDLRLLHEKRIPIFGLQAAMTQPETYAGRYVLLRAQVGDLRRDGETPTVWLVESSLSSVQGERPAAVAVREDTAETWSGNVGAQTEQLGNGTIGGSVGRAERKSKTLSEPTYDNITLETGREALGRLANPDPFLVPGRDFVILGRFDGMRMTAGTGEEAEEDAEAPKLPVLSIVHYFSPHPLVIY
jgi:hypothetical protein